MGLGAVLVVWRWQELLALMSWRWLLIQESTPISWKPNNFSRPRHAHQRWFAGQWGQVQAWLRVEIRSNSAADTWEDMEAELQHVEKVAAALVTKEIEFQHIVEGARLALGEAEAAGLFQCQGQSNNAAPGWKFHSWAFGFFQPLERRKNLNLQQSLILLRGLDPQVGRSVALRNQVGNPLWLWWFYWFYPPPSYLELGFSKNQK